MSKGKQITDAARPSVVDDSPHEVVTAAGPGRPADVAAERRVLEELRGRREAQLHRRGELEAERRAHAHAAHAQNDQEAGKLLARVIEQSFKLDQHIESLTDAIVEQERVVARAEAEAVREADREAALALRRELIRFLHAGKACHEALAAFAVASAALVAARDAMAALGCHFPSSEQLRVLGGAAVNTALMNTPWGVGRHLAPAEQKQFTKLVAGWSRTIERGIDARLGEAEPATKTEPEVAA
jgi:hypothetical protein